MKKSEAYHLAQIVVVNAPCITPESKLEILRYLIKDEDLALFCEKEDEEKAAMEE